jgi:hypothetical protein
LILNITSLSNFNVSGLFMGSSERRVECCPLLGPELHPAGCCHRHVHGRHYLLLHLHSKKFVMIDDVTIDNSNKFVE